MAKEYIRDFYNRIIGSIEVDPVTGDKIGRDFYGRIVGKWEKKLNVTRDFYGRIVAKGDALSGLIWQHENETHEVDISKKGK